MANDKSDVGLGKMPDALKDRRTPVTLSDGSSISVEEWSWMKFEELIVYVGDPKRIPYIAEMSVPEADRARVRAMRPVDLLAVAKAATDLNVTPESVKNFGGFLSAGASLSEAISRKSAP